jgi:predicted Zn-dependent protease
MLRSIALSAAALMMVTAMGCQGMEDLGDKVGGRRGAGFKALGGIGSSFAINEENEDALGQAVGISLTNTYRIVEDRNLLKYVNFIGLTVAMGSDDPAAKYLFGVLETEEINAFSGPGGYIFITRGALKFCKDEAELAGILAHEIAHCNHHDGLEEAKSAKARQGFAQGVAFFTNNEGYGEMLGGMVEVYTKQTHSQPSEIKADAAAVHFLANTGYNPNSYLNYLQRLASTPSPGGLKAFMSSHPGTPQRVEVVTQEIKTLKKTGGATLANRFAANVKK